jgi:hypothetical protein
MMATFVLTWIFVVLFAAALFFAWVAVTTTSGREARPFALAAAVFLGLAVWGICDAVRAQDHHHPLHKDFYHHWRAPDNPHASCCNARVEKDGTEIGDCEPTEARIVNGNWQAWVRQLGLWLPVPDAKILRERNPNIFDAHLCWTQSRGVICFVPPSTGG